MDDVLFLLKSAKTQDSDGVWKKTYTKRRVFCKVSSITRAEFALGGRSIDLAGRDGLNPQYMFSVFHGDYEGESVVEYNGATYAIYRTYRTDDDYIELYVQKEGGTSGKEAQ